MCTRFSYTHRLKLKAAWNQIKDPHRYKEKAVAQYNIAPTDEALVIVEDHGTLIFDRMIFGLVPHWAKDLSFGLHCLNARAETVADKPAFRHSFRQKRCLVLADGFYEWHRVGKKKIPYRFTLASNEPFALAGLWDEWLTPHGKKMRSFSIMTTQANTLLKKIHDRMPVILTDSAEKSWCDSKIDSVPVLQSLLQSVPASDMTCFEVTSKMNRSAYKEADCIEPVPPSSLAPSLFP